MLKRVSAKCLKFLEKHGYKMPTYPEFKQEHSEFILVLTTSIYTLFFTRGTHTY